MHTGMVISADIPPMAADILNLSLNILLMETGRVQMALKKPASTPSPYWVNMLADRIMK